MLLQTDFRLECKRWISESSFLFCCSQLTCSPNMIDNQYSRSNHKENATSQIPPLPSLPSQTIQHSRLSCLTTSGQVQQLWFGVLFQALSRCNVDETILFANYWNRIFKEQWIKSHGRSLKRHVAKLLNKSIQAELTLPEVFTRQPQRDVVIWNGNDCWIVAILIDRLPVVFSMRQLNRRIFRYVSHEEIH